MLRRLDVDADPILRSDRAECWRLDPRQRERHISQDVAAGELHGLHGVPEARRERNRSDGRSDFCKDQLIVGGELVAKHSAPFPDAFGLSRGVIGIVDPSTILVDHLAEILVLVIVPMPNEVLGPKDRVGDLMQLRPGLQIIVQPADQSAQRRRQVRKVRTLMVGVVLRDSVADQC